MIVPIGLGTEAFVLFQEFNQLDRNLHARGKGIVAVTAVVACIAAVVTTVPCISAVAGICGFSVGIGNRSGGPASIKDKVFGNFSGV